MGLEYREKKAITTEGESPERQQLLLVEQAVPRLIFASNCLMQSTGT